jgi:hypothetical protein
LKVLLKDMSGAQVDEVMEQRKAQLSMDCNACHANNKEKIDVDGRPLLNFADGSKPEKATAHVIYTMTEETTPGSSRKSMVPECQSPAEPATEATWALSR